MLHTISWKLRNLDNRTGAVVQARPAAAFAGTRAWSELLRFGVLALLTVSLAGAATFGRVVSIGGHAADIALDEPRGVLYIANYTSGRIDVMSVTDYSISRSITVPSYPGALALSPDGRYLVVTHYATTADGAALSQPGQNAVTVIEPANNQKRTFGLPSGPVGVAFGIDGRAVILTQDQLLLFDPLSGTTIPLDTVANVLSLPLPAETPNFPPQILAGSLTATADGKHIFGIGGTTPDTGTESRILLFSYDVANRRITSNYGLTSAPSLGPRTLSISRDGSYLMTGWALLGCGTGFLGDCTAQGPLLAQWPHASGKLNVGSLAIRSSKSLIYAQISQEEAAATATSQTQCFANGVCVTLTTPGTTSAQGLVPPNLMVLDADNLTVRDRFQLPENLAGRSVFNSDESVLYSVSDSGVTVFPMTQLERAPRLAASVEDVVFRGSFCAGTALTQQIDIVDPSGAAVPFQICSASSATCTLPSGITVSPSAGVTPAKVKITVGLAAGSSFTGTQTYQLDVRSGTAVNLPAPPSRGSSETYTTNVRTRFRVLVNNREPENRGAFVNVPGELVETIADPVRNRFYVLRLDRNQVLVFDGSNANQIATLRTGNTPMSMAITLDRKYLLVGNDNSQIANRYDLDTLQQVQPIVFPRGHYPRSIAVSGRAILSASRVAGPVHTIDRVDMSRLVAETLTSLGPFKNDISASTKLTESPNGSAIFGAMPNGKVLLYNANVDSFTIVRQDTTELKGAIAASGFGYFMVDHFLLNDSLVNLGQVISSQDTSSGFAFVDQDAYSTAVSKAGKGYIQRLQSNVSGTPLPTAIVEAPLVGDTDTDLPFRRSLAPLADRSAIIALSTSGFTILPWNYDAARVPPTIDRLVNAGDFTKPVAPGGLVSIFGTGLSPMTLANQEASLPTVLADSCLTVNGVIVPVSFVSPTQINAQLPVLASGTAEIVLRTPGGTTDPLRFTILPAAPAVFRSGSGPLTGVPAVVRDTNGGLVTVSNPIHFNDHLTIYVTGMGRTTPEVPAGQAAPFDPLSTAVQPPTVTLGGASLFVDYAGLTPGLVGVGQINVTVPFKGVPTGFDLPLTITQAGFSTTIQVRVVN